MSSFSELINSKTEPNVLIDFSAEWCQPCHMLKPILAEVKQNLGDKVKIVKIDVDRNRPLAESFQIQGVPTLMFFKGGEQVWRQSGVIPAAQLTSILQQHM